MSRALLLLLATVASGCVSDPTWNDLATTQDLVGPDSALPDLVEVRDLGVDDTASADLSDAVDLAIVADLASGEDLVTLEDLAPPSDLTPLVWTPRNTGLHAGNFYNVAVGDDDHLWVQTLYDIYESTDDAATFEHVVGDTRSISAIAARGDSLYFAPSGGGVWRQVGTDPPIDLTAGPNAGTPPLPAESVALLAAPRGSAASLLYAVTATPVVYRYDPAGTTHWTDISTSTGLFDSELVSRVAVDDNSADLYLSSTSGHWRWNSSTVMWDLDTSQGTSPNALDVAGSGNSLQKVLYQPTSVATDVLRKFATNMWGLAPAPPFAPDYLSIGAGFEIAACSDLGIERLPSASSSWETIPDTANFYCTGIDRSPDRAVAYFATGKGIARLASADETPTISSQGVSGMTVNQYAWHPKIAGRVFAATDHGLYRSDDSGAIWTRVGSGLPDTPFVRRVAIGAGDLPPIFVVTADKLWRSLDGGGSFVDTGRAAATVVASPSVEGQIYYCAPTGNLFTSQSANQATINFTAIPSVTKCKQLYQHDADTLFVATDLDILRSTNAGSGAATFPLFFHRSNVVSMTATNTGEVYAVAGSTLITRSVYRVTTASETKLTAASRAQAIWLTDDGDVLLGARGGVFRRSGDSFVALGEGLPNLDVVALACAAGGSPRCLASVEERGSFTLR